MLNRNGTHFFVTMAAATCLMSEPAGAADRALVGQALVRETCPLTHATATKGDRGQHDFENFGALLGTFGAGIVGDAIGAVGNALGAALEQASRERTFSVEGNASFDYYRVEGEDPQNHRLPRVQPALSANGSYCLVLAFGEAGVRSGPIGWPTNQAEVEPVAVSSGLLTNQGLDPRPALYIEAELQSRADGFRVRPVLVWYRTRLPGAPTNRLPAELHATFSVPGGPSADTGQQQVFAVARMPLPPLEPNTVLLASQLQSYSSGALPARPTAGSADSIVKMLADEINAKQVNDREIAALLRAIPRAAQRASAPNAPADARAALLALEERLDVARANSARLDARAAWVRSRHYPIPAGTTNVTVRLALVRDANAFGMAIAGALRTRSTQLGTAVTTALTPEGRAAAWTVSDTNYVTQMSLVDTKQRALNQATLAGDAQAIFTAEQDLRLAKAGANAAAATANRSLPFPGLQ